MTSSFMMGTSQQIFNGTIKSRRNGWAEHTARRGDMRCIPGSGRRT